MKNNRGLLITLIVVLSILCVLLVAVMGFMIGKSFGGFSFNFGLGREYPIAFEQEYDNNFDAISIDANASNIKIKNSADDKVHLTVWADENKLKVSDENGVLEIIENSEGSVQIGIGRNKTAKIELYLPKGYDKIIDVECDYGNLEMESFPSARLDADADYGNIEIDEISDITVSCAYGNIEIGTVNSALSLKADCGNVEIGTANLIKNSTIECDFGNIEIGKVNDVFIDADTELGEKKIASNNQNSDIILKIENDCGNITVG